LEIPLPVAFDKLALRGLVLGSVALSAAAWLVLVAPLGIILIVSGSKYCGICVYVHEWVFKKKTTAQLQRSLYVARKNTSTNEEKQQHSGGKTATLGREPPSFHRFKVEKRYKSKHNTIYL